MEIHLFLRDDLRAPAAGTAPLDAEHGTETRLAKRHDGAGPQPAQSHGQPDRGDGLPFTQRRGVDGGDQHVAAERPVAEPIERSQHDLALVAAVGDQLILEEAEFVGKLLYLFERRRGGRGEGGGLPPNGAGGRPRGGPPYQGERNWLPGGFFFP